MPEIRRKQQPARQQSRPRLRARLHRPTSTFVVFFSMVLVLKTFAQQQQDPSTMNGGSILAMAGKDCVALAVDKRFGSGPALVNVQPRQVLLVPPPSRLVVAFSGLDGDVQSLCDELKAQVASKYTRGLGFFSSSSEQAGALSNNKVSPRCMASLTSHILYNRRQAPYYVEPIVVGLEEQMVSKEKRIEDTEKGTTKAPQDQRQQFYRPYLCSMDMIGAKSVARDFCCAGAATQSLYGTAEALWKPNLSSDKLVQVCGKAFLSALERDCLSGYGAKIYLITAQGITEYDLASRND